MAVITIDRASIEKWQTEVESLKEKGAYRLSFFDSTPDWKVLDEDLDVPETDPTKWEDSDPIDTVLLNIRKSGNITWFGSFKGTDINVETKEIPLSILLATMDRHA